MWKRVLVLLLLSCPALADVTVTLTNSQPTVTRTNVPVTISQVFKKGEFPSGVAVVGDASCGPVSQVDIKARHADGSVRHAMISTVLPTVAGPTVNVVLTPGAVQTPPKDVLPNVAGELGRVDFTIDGIAYSAVATTAAARDLWLNGNVVQEVRIPVVPTTVDGTPHPHLLVLFDVRLYQGYTRVDVTVEHPWIDVAPTRTYTYDVAVMDGSRQVFGKLGVVHAPQQRWRKVYWAGGNDPGLVAKMNGTYLMGTRAVPNYKTDIVLYRPGLDKSATTLAGPQGEILNRGLIDAYMPGVGNYHGIGILPQDHVQWLVTDDPTARSVSMQQADLFGSWPMHYREKNLGLPNFLARPLMAYTSQRGDTYDKATKIYGQTAYAYCKSLGTTCNDPVSFYPEIGAHQPSEAYLPYLMTGERYYIEEIGFWSSFSCMGISPPFRGFSECVPGNVQVRGFGWTMRTLGQCAYIAPDGSDIKAECNRILANNVAHYTSKMATSDAWNRFGIFETPLTWSPYGNVALAPWQQDFAASSLLHMWKDLGIDLVAPMAQQMAKFSVARLTSPDWCYQFAADYNLTFKEVPGGPVVASWKDVQRLTYANWKDPVTLLPLPPGDSLACESPELQDALNKYYKVKMFKPGVISRYPDGANGYVAQMQPAVALAVDAGIPGAAEAWAKMRANPVQVVATGYYSFGAAPMWNIIPRQ